MQYSDDDTKHKYFENEKEVVNHLFLLEETNLFKIKHLEDAE